MQANSLGGASSLDSSSRRDKEDKASSSSSNISRDNSRDNISKDRDISSNGVKSIKNNSSN